MRALKRSTEVVEHREGGDPEYQPQSPGPHQVRGVTLERGVTHDLEFERWANKVWNFGAGLGAEVSLKDFRKDIMLEVYNEAGQMVLAYNLFRCWVSEFQALPDLDANANAIAIQTLKLENEGWERDLRRARARGTQLRRAAGLDRTGSVSFPPWSGSTSAGCSPCGTWPWNVIRSIGR